MQTIWGLDLGVTSVGFAVLKWDEWASAEGSGEIVRLGVRIFPECREEKDLSPKNAVRRQARLTRRQVRRRRWRRVHLRALLAEAGLLPSPDAKPLANQDPYVLRARGLTGALELHELGWALFHLLKRRGFQGSRKRPDTRKDAAAKADEEAEGRALALSAKLNGGRLSEYLAGIETTIETPARRRGVGQTRPMVQDELEAQWAVQRRHHPERLTNELRERIDYVALRQRPTFFRRRTFGQCDLEPGAPRALKAEWIAQHFETLQLVNALRLEGGNQRGLDAAERAQAVAYLESTSKPTWPALRQAVGLSRLDRFTHERGKKESVRGNATEAALRRALGPQFGEMPAANAIRTAMGEAWHRVAYRPVNGGAILEIRDAKGIEAERVRLAARAEAELGLSPAQAASLAKLDLPDGTGRHSLAAMRRLVPRLEAGEPYMTAVRGEYGERERGPPVDQLPGPNEFEVRRIKDPFVKRRMQALLAGVRNPTVLRTLGELQKVADTLLRAYGRPDLIRLEMARDLKRSAEERRKTDGEQWRREKARTSARGKLREMGKSADGREGAETCRACCCGRNRAAAAHILASTCLARTH